MNWHHASVVLLCMFIHAPYFLGLFTTLQQCRLGGERIKIHVNAVSPVKESDVISRFLHALVQIMASILQHYIVLTLLGFRDYCENQSIQFNQMWSFSMNNMTSF